MRRIASAFLGLLFIFCFLLTPLNALAEVESCETPDCHEKHDEYETRYTLQDSTIYSNWNLSCIEYNCYSYAIGNTTESLDPGMKSGQKNKFYYAINTRNLTAAVEIIKNDLKIQNICVASTTSRTTALALPTKYKVICFRIQTSNYSQTSDKAENDYHFMKYDR